MFSICSLTVDITFSVSKDDTVELHSAPLATKHHSPMFTAAKAGQMAAFFADKEGAPVSVLKLVKLMYLADRESMRQYGRPMSFDTMVSMPHGPVSSHTLDLINGFTGGAEGDAWDYWISGRDGHFVELRRDFERKDLDQLSNADLRVLDTTWTRFGHMDQWELRDFTHDHCSEWRDPTNSEKQSIRIDEIDIFRAVGIEEKEAAELAQELKIGKSLDMAFSQV